MIVNLLHPSMAGVNLEGIKLRMTSRKHWLDQINAPNLQTFSADARLNDRTGVGMIIFKDENGWYAEYRIPYNALRFPEIEIQDWSINFFRQIKSKNETYSWNFINNKIGNQKFTAWPGVYLAYAKGKIQTDATYDTVFAVPMDVSFKQEYEIMQLNFEFPVEFYKININKETSFSFNSFLLTLTVISNFPKKFNGLNKTCQAYFVSLNSTLLHSLIQRLSVNEVYGTYETYGTYVSHRPHRSHKSHTKSNAVIYRFSDN